VGQSGSLSCFRSLDEIAALPSGPGYPQLPRYCWATSDSLPGVARAFGFHPYYASLTRRSFSAGAVQGSLRLT